MFFFFFFHIIQRSHEKNIRELIEQNSFFLYIYIWVIDKACSIKMAGYSTGQVLNACVYGQTD